MRVEVGRWRSRSVVECQSRVRLAYVCLKRDGIQFNKTSGKINIVLIRRTSFFIALLEAYTFWIQHEDRFLQPFP